MRSNQNWIDALTGKQGFDNQQTALRDLNIHLHTVAYHQLNKVSSSKAVLSDLTTDELSQIAMDFAQDAIEKIMRDDFALLAKYSRTGTFEAWTARITARIISSELRRPFWVRRKAISKKQEMQQQDDTQSPEQTTLIDEAIQALHNCIAQLSERRRVIFIRSAIEEEAAEELAKEFQSSANAIHILNYRSREKLRQCLKKKGFDKDTLDIFKI